VSVTTEGNLGDERSSIPFPPVASVVTPNGRFVAFESMADDLVPEDTSRSHEFAEIFVRDMRKRTTERVNVSSGEGQANRGVQAGDDFYRVFPNSALGGISDSGRFVVFASTSSNLVPGDTNRAWDVFVRDLRAGTTSRISVSSTGRQGSEDSFLPVISADGSFVAFASGASNLVPRDRNRRADIFVHELAGRTTTRVSLGSGGQEARYPPGLRELGTGSNSPAISADGSVVAFSSDARNLVPDDTNDLTDVFVKDLSSGETSRVNVSSDGAEAQPVEIQEIQYGGSSSVGISGDGTVVMFATMAPNLVPGDTNKLSDTFVHDLKTGRTERVSVSSSGRQATGCLDDQCLAEEGSAGGSISFDGRLVAFTAGGSLAPGDRDDEGGTNHDVFIHDRRSGQTILAAYRHDRTPAAAPNIYGPSLSTNGRWLVYGADDRKIVRRTRGVEAFGWVYLQELPRTLFE
jgi:Tol biopolymer transport system component